MNLYKVHRMQFGQVIGQYYELERAVNEFGNDLCYGAEEFLAKYYDRGLDRLDKLMESIGWTRERIAKEIHNRGIPYKWFWNHHISYLYRED